MGRNKLYKLEVFGDKDEITIQELYDYFGVNTENKRKAKKWEYNRIYVWGSGGLIEAVHEGADKYNYGGYVSKLRLTEKGKKALGRESGNPMSTAEIYPVSETQSGGNVDSALYDVLNLVADWSREHPEYEVSFEIKSRDGSVAIHTP